MRVVVATHGHCFDGLASAALFSRLFSHVSGRQATFEYRACGYGIGQRRADRRLLDGDDNAILDYRFCATDKLSWFFDHHRTAFASAADRDVFEARGRSGQMFHDAAYSSCTLLLADVGRERFGFEQPALAELVRWADTIDAARFSSAEAATRYDQPALRLAAVVEHHADDAFLSRHVPALCERSLAEVASSEEVVRRFAPLAQRQADFRARVRATAERMGRVVYVDLSGAVLETLGKFVTYALFPESMYSVLLAEVKAGLKISVGHNPWCGQPLDADISALCARHGGGGHPYVGGISFPKKELLRARAVARGIAAELAG